MKRIKKKDFIFKLFERLYVQQWTIGYFLGDIKEIIKNKSFNPEIKWVPIEPLKRFFADPFLLQTNDGSYSVFIEEFDIKRDYGKISLMKIGKSFNIVYNKVLLDTTSHLSYPYIFKENNGIYVFPEAGKSGKLVCYEYDAEKETLKFLRVIIDLPIVDPTILKYDGKYWLFGTLKGKDSFNKLHIFFSDNLLGPYRNHNQNPVKNAFDGSRPAGSFLLIGDAIYRPAQNCKKLYGESITINKVNELNEFNFKEEPYMLISINKGKRCNRRIHSIHTINAEENLIVIDGKQKKFAPFSVLKNYIKKA